MGKIRIKHKRIGIIDLDMKNFMDSQYSLFHEY